MGEPQRLFAGESNSSADPGRKWNQFQPTVAKVMVGDVLIEKMKIVQKALQSFEFQKATTLLKELEDSPFAQPVEDLILYWKGSGLMALSIDEALETLEKLIRRCFRREIYCSPSIVKKARRALIELRLLNNREIAIKELEDYIRNYPEDDYALYLLSYLYKEEGRDVSSLYKRLYIRNSNYLRFIKEDIGQDGINQLVTKITVEELEQKVKGLMLLGKYKEAEELIKIRLNIEDSRSNKESLRRLLGNLYFRQKRYTLAAEQFLTSKEYYLLALSYLRSGSDEEAQKVLQKLIRSKDRRVVPVAIAYTRNLRNKGEINIAIQYLKELLKIFPYDAEQIYWAIAWTHYRTGTYDEALKVLRLLSSRYKDSRYDYWLLRTEEKAGLVEKEQKFRALQELVEKERFQEDNVYSVLAKLRLNTEELPLGHRASDSFLMNKSFQNLTAPSHTITLSCRTVDDRTVALCRAAVFTELGLKDEFSQDLYYFVNKCLEQKSGTGGFFQTSMVPPISLENSVELMRVSASCSQLLPVIGFFYAKTEQIHHAVSLYGRLKSVPGLKEQIDDSMLYPLAFSELVRDASITYGIDPFLLLAVMREESRYNPEAISPAGAIGLLQIMPYTARRLTGDFSSNGINLMDPSININLGAKYLKELLQRYGEIPYALAAYNAGERAVDSWLKNNYSSIDEFIEDIPYGETIRYVKRVLTTYDKYRRIYGKP